MASLAQGRECFGSRCGGKTGMAAGVRGDQQLSKGLLGRKKERKPTCGGDGTKAPLPSVGRYTAQAKCKRLVRLRPLSFVINANRPSHLAARRNASSLFPTLIW